MLRPLLSPLGAIVLDAVIYSEVELGRLQLAQLDIVVIGDAIEARRAPWLCRGLSPDSVELAVVLRSIVPLPLLECR